MTNEIKYAGFWQRFGAYLIDMICLMPIMALVVWLGFKYRDFQFYYFLPGLMFSFWFHIYLVKRYGGTPGKLLLKTKIQMIDGSPVNWRGAILRNIVLFLLSALQAVAQMIATLQVTYEDYASMDWKTLSLHLNDFQPSWAFYVNIALQVWVFSEFLVLLTNKKRRALHDFLAGTVVIRTASPST